MNILTHPPSPAISAATYDTREAWLAARDGSIGGSEVAALFGIHPWLTPYHLWALKTGRMDASPDNAALARGRRLESFVLTEFGETHPEWILTPNPMPGGMFYRYKDRPQSATPDGFATHMHDPAVGVGLVQVKTSYEADFKRDWTVAGAAGAIEVPAYIQLQTQAEMALTGAPYTLVLVMSIGRGFEVHDVIVRRDEAVITAIGEAIDNFWLYVERDLIPPLNFERDLRPAIKAVHRAGGYDPNDVVNFGDNIALITACAKLMDVKHDLKLLGEEKDAAEAFIRASLGNSSVGIAGPYTFSAKLQHRAAFSVEESSSRPLRVKMRNIE